MKSCEQTQGMSIYEHGVSVNKYFIDLYNYIHFNTNLNYEWKLPEWIFEKSLWSSILDLDIIYEYQIFHDCGKPFCLTLDLDGKRHFTNHTEFSRKTWLDLNASNDKNIQIGKLISMDMDIHLLKDEGILDFCKNKEAATLLITGLCEIHSNASMFGGIDSISFKSKFKNINKRGKKITTYLTEKNNEK